MRTSWDVYNRLKWDTSINVDVSQVYIGYRDRFVGMCEMPFHEYRPGSDIPFHRIYYFRTNGAPVNPRIGRNGEVIVGEHNWPKNAVLLWDRETKTDLIFNST